MSPRPSRRAAAITLGAIALCVALAFARSARASSELDAANRAFAVGHHAAAATQFESLLSRRGYSAPVLFDLGNAYLRADRPVDAILAYERARLLAPRDPAIVANLVVARKIVGLPEESGLANLFEHLLSPDGWTWLAMGGMWLGVAAGAGAILWSRRRGPLLAAAGACALVASVAGAGLGLSSRVLHAGLATRSTPVFVSPFASAQSSFSLGPGAAVELGAVHEGFVLVHGRDGRSGWVELGAVAPVIPD
jgi:hypothetical protein